MAYTDEQKAQLAGFVAKWKPRCRVSHWRVEIDWEKKPEDPGTCLLETNIQIEIHYARIRVGDFFGEGVSDRDRENAVVHELLHIHAQPLWETVEALCAELGSQARAHVRGLAKQQLEQMVDNAATILVPFDD